MGTDWKGSTKYIKKRTEAHGADGVREASVVWEGQYETLIANKPAIASTLTGTTCSVESVTIQQGDEGDKAVMTATGSNRLSITTDEIEWTRTEQDIRWHPKFMTSGTWQLSDDDRQKVEKKLANPTDSTVKTPTGSGYQLYKRLLAGQTSYPVYLPVVRRTAYYLAAPTSAGCGKQETPTPAHPSTDGNGKSYVYVRTSDRSVRRGYVWENVKEWTGFLSIDEAILT